MRRNWTKTILGEICQIKPPKKEAKQKLSDKDMVSFVPMKNLGICSKTLTLGEDKTLKDVVGSYTYFAEEDVLLAKITPCFENGKLGIAKNLTNGVGFGSSEFIVFRSKGGVDPEYLFHFLSRKSFREAGARVMTGAVGHKRVPKEFINDHPILLPSLPEQKRIVSILDEALEGIAAAVANTEKNLANVRELFESYLNGVFTRKGDGWVEKTLGDVCDLISGQHIDSKNYNIDQKGIAYLTGPSDFGVRNPTVSKWTEFPKRTALSGDILITVKGSGVGKINLLDYEELAISRQLMAVRAKGAITEFLYEFLSLQFAYFQSLANGAAIPGISRADVLNLKLSIPGPSEQERIIADIDEYKAQTQRLESIYQQKLTSLAELKQSILQKAFAGELTALPDKTLEEAVA